MIGIDTRNQMCVLMLDDEGGIICRRLPRLQRWIGVRPERLFKLQVRCSFFSRLDTLALDS